MKPDHARLRALALAAGGDVWSSDGEVDGYVFGADGDSVCECHANAGAMPEFIYPNDRAHFIAAANPAAVLALLDQLQRTVQHQDDLRSQLARVTAQVKALQAERNDLIIERNAALVRAIKGEHPSRAGLTGLKTRAEDYAVPNDRLDDILPLASDFELQPIHLPASLELPARRAFDRSDVERIGGMPPLPPLDLADSEGGDHD